jgi:hypothetical protein
MPLYQLAIPKTTGRRHVPFVYFSNGLGGDQRFCVVVTHRKLSKLETQSWCERIVEFHGSEAPLGRRGTSSTGMGGFNGDYSNVDLEYLRYLIIWRGESIAHMICLDTLCDVTIDPDTTEATVDACRLAIVAAPWETVGRGQRSLVPGSTARADRKRTVYVDTESHGRVTITCSTFKDPDARNGIGICASKVVDRSNTWGAMVRAVNPKRFVIRHFLRRPPAFPRGVASCAAANTGDYYHEIEGRMVGDPETVHRMMIPRGGHGRANAIDWTEPDGT